MVDVVERLHAWNRDGNHLHGPDKLSVEAAAEILALRARVAELTDEVAEQARVNGMGSEREARLMAQVKELTRERDQAREDVPAEMRGSYENGREDERRAVVDWLRDDAAKCKTDFERIRTRGGFTNAQMWEWGRLIEWKVALAQAIASGAHREGKDA